jgi:hypothetical protein
VRTAAAAADAGAEAACCIDGALSCVAARKATGESFSGGELVKQWSR